MFVSMIMQRVCSRCQLCLGTLLTSAEPLLRQGSELSLLNNRPLQPSISLSARLPPFSLRGEGGGSYLLISLPLSFIIIFKYVNVTQAGPVVEGRFWYGSPKFTRRRVSMTTKGIEALKNTSEASFKFRLDQKVADVPQNKLPIKTQCVILD